MSAALTLAMGPIKQDIVSDWKVEVKVEEHSIEMDCQITVKQESNAKYIQDLQVKSELFNTHKLTHIDKSSYQCSYCSKCFLKDIK